MYIYNQVTQGYRRLGYITDLSQYFMNLRELLEDSLLFYVWHVTAAPLSYGNAY